MEEVKMEDGKQGSKKEKTIDYLELVSNLDQDRMKEYLVEALKIISEDENFILSTSRHMGIPARMLGLYLLRRVHLMDCVKKNQVLFV